jgi:hypothetical protein
MPGASVTLFRHASPNWPGGPTVHFLDQRHGFMLVAPPPCRAVMAEILTEQATVARDKLMRVEPGALVNRGYCRHCLGTLAK